MPELPLSTILGWREGRGDETLWDAFSPPLALFCIQLDKLYLVTYRQMCIRESYIVQLWLFLRYKAAE